MNRLFLPYNICIEYHQARINLFGNKNEHICLVTKKKKTVLPYHMVLMWIFKTASDNLLFYYDIILKCFMY